MNEIRQKGHAVLIIQIALLIDALANTLDDILNTLSAFVLLYYLKLEWRYLHLRLSYSEV